MKFLKIVSVDITLGEKWYRLLRISVDGWSTLAIYFLIAASIHNHLNYGAGMTVMWRQRARGRASRIGKPGDTRLIL